jgi:signal transduction histidine kinase
MGALEQTGRSLRDWFVDVVCFLLAIVGGLIIFGTAADIHTAPTALLALDAVFGSLACLSMWWRRRWPVQIGIVLGVISCFSAMSQVAATIALFTVALHRPARAVAVVGGVQLAAGLAYIALRPDPTSSVWVVVAFLLLVMAATIAWGMFVRARRQLVGSLRERADRAEAEQQLQVSQARQLERTRIAREMHDVLAHRISLISLHAGALEFRAEAVGADIAQSAAVIRGSAHQALEDLREVIGVLRDESDQDGPERPQPTLDDVRGLIEESQHAGMHVTVDFAVDDSDCKVPLSVGRTAYRIVQEGLTNVRKHAPGAAVTVRLDGHPGPGLNVEVLSRWPVGPAVAPRIPGGGRGLVGLAERTDLAGGRLDHGRTAEGNFRLCAWLPWPV